MITADGVHSKRGTDENAPKTLRVDYKVGLDKWISEWICFEHVGFPRKQAKKWWRKRTNRPTPMKAVQALKSIESAGIACARLITVRFIPGSHFPKIIGYVFQTGTPKRFRSFAVVNEGVAK